MILTTADPTFAAIFADRSRRIWVLRPARSLRAAECTEDPLDENAGGLIPCYETENVADVFYETTGKLPGEVKLPGGAGFSPSFTRDDEVHAAIEDKRGTIVGKRYRLVLPDDASP